MMKRLKKNYLILIIDYFYSHMQKKIKMMEMIMKWKT